MSQTENGWLSDPVITKVQLLDELGDNKQLRQDTHWWLNTVALRPKLVMAEVQDHECQLVADLL